MQLVCAKGIMKLIVLVQLNGRNYFVQNIRGVVHVTINNN